MNLKQKDTLIIVLLLFFFVLIWIGEGIYRSVVSSTISEDVAQAISPISPNFDTKTIEKLKTREKIEPIYATPSASPNTAIPTLIPTSAPVATEGGLLAP
jgi:hypothetical protein